jgi:hypothetical protein
MLNVDPARDSWLHIDLSQALDSVMSCAELFFDLYRAGHSKIDCEAPYARLRGTFTRSVYRCLSPTD